jgi:hypothetical protein
MNRAAWLLPPNKDAQSVEDALLALLDIEGNFDA